MKSPIQQHKLKSTEQLSKCVLFGHLHLAKSLCKILRTELEQQQPSRELLGASKSAECQDSTMALASPCHSWGCCSLVDRQVDHSLPPCLGAVAEVGRDHPTLAQHWLRLEGRPACWWLWTRPHWGHVRGSLLPWPCAGALATVLLRLLEGLASQRWTEPTSPDSFQVGSQSRCQQL